jgi:hypothetical protein
VNSTVILKLQNELGYHDVLKDQFKLYMKILTTQPSLKLWKEVR